MAYKRSRKAFEADLQKQESPYVFLGTPLPPLDERINDDGSFVPLWKQEVTDDRGRKRLHGAFTGGYSAGYFNTVGSREGWTPSNFVSSRQKGVNGQQPRQQRVEDFMDEEDLREAEEARSLQTSETFAGFGDTTAASRENTLIDIFRPSGETVGAKLLKRMGWKEGHGIGPRIKRAADLGEGQFSKDQTHTFAPPDVPVLALSQKTDRKGLGFESSDASIETKFGQSTRTTPKPNPEHGDEDDDSSRDALSLFKPRQAARTRKGGFGVGVLNDTGSDDEDPYSMGPRISYNKTLGGDKPGRKEKKKPLAKPSLRNKPVLLSEKLGLQSALRKCHDGRLPLDGFVLGDQVDAMSKLSLTKDKYRPPEVPAGWVSKLTPTDTEHEESTFVSTSDAAKASDHNAKTRASVLGEKSLPGKSVFDYLSPATRDHLAVVTGNQNLPAGLGEAPSASEGARGSRRDIADLVPYLDQSAAVQALSRSSESSTGWLPYAEDLDKRERYMSFLQIKAGLSREDAANDLPPRAAGMSQADWINEMNEFARAAEVFKPISGLMANRFTSSSSANVPTQEGTDVDSGTLVTYKRNKPKDPAESAAKMGMFGQMTRSVTSFYPTRMLCKRFGVPMPDLSDPPAGQNPTTAVPSRQDLFSNASKFQSAGYQSNEKSEPAPSSAAEGAASVATAKADSYDGVDPNRNEVLEQEKPGMALFKSIFGSDDEDEDD